jgi:iron complex outermembrane receptor protein
MNLPLRRTLDLTLAGRFDRYGDFGGTANPKLGLRWQPLPELVVRGAASTGFRAPSLYELYAAPSYTNTNTTLADPAFCPGGSGTGPVSDCEAQFVALLGGNADLKPEQSKSFTLGAVLAPLANLRLGADYWLVRISDLISSLPYETLLDPTNQDWAAQYIHRVNGRLSTATQICPGAGCGYIDDRGQNSGDMLTDGLDLNANYRVASGIGQFDLAYDGTYVRRYSYQDYAGGPWNRSVGVFQGVGPVFRWKHVLSGAWQQDAYSAGAMLHVLSGYSDDPYGEFPDLRIGTYATLDIYGGWEPLMGLNLVLGIQNLADKAPPLSGQAQTFQSGYDPRYYDPTGRTYYARVNYHFNWR